MFLNKYVEGQVFESNNPIYGSFKVIKIHSSTNVDIQFLNTGTITKTVGRSLVKGQVKDPLLPVVCGVGFIGIGKHHTMREYVKIHRAWSNMLIRCYSPKNIGYPSYGAKGCYVSEVWHNYQNFAEWYLSSGKGFTNLHLDKDIIQQGNKEYGPDRCLLVPREINILLMLNHSSRGEYPIGVSPSIYGTSYKAVISDKYKILSDSIHPSLGSYDTPEKAHSVWQTAKIKLIEGAIYRYANTDYFDTKVAGLIMCRVWQLRLEQAEGKQTTIL